MIRKLPETWTAFRIGDPYGTWPIWDDGGARKSAGRWHEAGAGVIYAARYYSTAMLEKLVHYQGRVPPNQHFIEITVPAGISYEVANPDHLEGWAARDGEVARRFGMGWYTEDRSAVLVVPSVVARMESNLVFNTRHPDFAKIRPGLETPIWWDKRLFAS
ncbi:MAG: RES domain-containing protein [Pseudomonadota bacterium]